MPVAVVVAEEIDVLSDCRLLLEQGVVCPSFGHYYSLLLFIAFYISATLLSSRLTAHMSHVILNE